MTFLTAQQTLMEQQSLQMLRDFVTLRHRFSANATLAVMFLIFGCAYGHAADRPNYSGQWELDPASSPNANGAAISLRIEDDSGKITYQRSLTQRDGKKVDAHFTCSLGGAQCEFDENGHKASVSLWYDGSALMILKTNGPKEDATIERRLELSPDGKTLKVQFTNLDTDSNGKSEVLVFKQQPSPNVTASR